MLAYFRPARTVVQKWSEDNESGIIGLEEALPKKGARAPEDLHPLVWLGFPAATLAICLLAPLLGHSRWEALMVGELAFIELTTVAFLLPAFVLSTSIFRRRSVLPRGVGPLMLLVGFAGLFFALEEIDYGQTLFGFEAPQIIASLNRAGEFNTHKIEGLHHFTNSIPRLVLFVLCLVGGVILPVALRKRLSAPDARKKAAYWLVPNHRLAPAALLAVLSTFPEKVCKTFHVEYSKTSYGGMALVEPGGELKEYCFAMVILLYLWSVSLRARREVGEHSGGEAVDRCPGAAAEPSRGGEVRRNKTTPETFAPSGK